MRPDGYPTGFKFAYLSLAAAPHLISLGFSYVFLYFLVCFSRVFSQVLGIFCPFVTYLSISGILLYFSNSFQFLLKLLEYFFLEFFYS
jgi:hypothetical protein